MKEDWIVVRAGKAAAMLAECRNATDAKKIVDMAHAASVYAKRQKLGDEAINYATAVKVDAMTRMGDFLRTVEKNKGGGEKGVGRRGKQCGSISTPHSFRPTLKEFGISKKESSICQKLSVAAQKEPETHRFRVPRPESRTHVSPSQARRGSAPPTITLGLRWRLVLDDAAC